MSLADTVRRLVEAGATPEVIMIAVEAIEAERKALDANREAARERTRRYRSRGGGNIPDDLRREVMERDGYACQECGDQERLECDHVHPVSKGGETTLANLQVLCRTCNARKKDRVRKSETRKSGGIPADNLGQTLPLPPSPQTPQPPTPSRVDNTPLPPEGRSRRKPSRPILPGFPTDEDIAEQQGKARTAGANLDVRAQAERFRNHAEQNDRRCADWRAAWRNWIAAAIERAPKTALAASLDRAQPSDADRWRRWLREFRQNGHWPSDDAGPRPGHPACRVPPALLAEFGFAPPPANDPTDLFDRGAAA